MSEPRLEGQTGTPVYMTDPPLPSWRTWVNGHGESNGGTRVEVRMENGIPWVRERRPAGGGWRQWCQMEGAESSGDHQRIEAARCALVDAGYFAEEEVGKDIAPRIVEMLAAICAGKWDGETQMPTEPTMCACPAWSSPHVRNDAFGCPDDPEDLLTIDEHMAINLAGRLAGMLARIIGTDNPESSTAAADMREMVGPIHAIQNALLAQAGARAYPDRYRLMGETLRTEEDS